MSTDSNRGGQTSSPPPAPPLPPRYGHRAATALAKLAPAFFAGSKGSQQADGREAQDRDLRSYNRTTPTSLSPKEAVHKTGLSIAAVDISPNGTHAILAGREILKTIQVGETTCTEEFNLRSRIITYASTHDTNRDALAAQHRDQLAAIDVKWSHGNLDSTIATAAANGRIIIYDLNRPSVEVARIHEHSRQVFQLAFSPHKPSLLLSGSQDGTIRLWDLRALEHSDSGGRSVREFRSSRKYSANSEAVRDIKWSPNDGYVFAVGTENGSVQRWDWRREAKPTLRLHGHDRSCSAIDWHPDGRFLASASADRTVKIWDLGREDRRMRPLSELRTPQSVMRMRWRPNSGPTDGAVSGETTTQICTSYNDRDPRIHIWDLQRPSVPAQEIEKYDTPATSMVWHSRDRLWTVGHTGTFTQNDLKQTKKPLERYGSVLAIGPDGRMAFFTNDKSDLGIASELLRKQLTSSISEANPEIPLHSTLDPSPEQQDYNSLVTPRRQKAVDFATSDSFESTHGPDDPTQALDLLKQQLLPTKSFSQLAAIGQIPQVQDSQAFVYLASNYCLPSEALMLGHDDQPHLDIQAAFEENALHAEKVGDTRLAQTWKILGQIVKNDLWKRAERACKARQTLSQPTQLQKEHKPDVTITEAKATPLMSTLGAALKKTSSNLSTPVARPRQDHSIPDTHLKDEFSLLATSGVSDSSSESSYPQNSIQNLSGPSVNMIDSLTAVNGPYQETEPTVPEHAKNLMVPGFAGLDDHLEERRNVLSSYRAKPRNVFTLGNPYTLQSPSNAVNSDRRDSNESFQMFSASLESENRAFLMDESFDERRSQISSDSFTTPGQAAFARTKLGDLREDDGHTAPGSVETQDDVDLMNLAKLEKTTTQATNDLEFTEIVNRPTELQAPKVHRSEFEASHGTASHNVNGTTKVNAADFLAVDTSNLDPLPWSMRSILRPLIDYHLSTLYEPQLPTILALWLWPFFASEFSRGQITSLMLFYHRRLQRLQLFSAAAQLRKCCSILFPELLDYTADCPPAKVYCRTCRKAFDTAINRNKDEAGQVDVCQRCKYDRGQCSICESVNPPPLQTSINPSVSRDLWSWCQACGHGGHASCLVDWFSNPSISEGSCAIPGCGHDCVPGPRREQVISELESAEIRIRKSVVSDEWRVGESKAVEKARDIVTEGFMGRGGKGRGAVANVPAAGGGGQTNAPGPGLGRRVRLKVDENTPST